MRHLSLPPESTVGFVAGIACGTSSASSGVADDEKLSANLTILTLFITHLCLGIFVRLVWNRIDGGYSKGL